MYKITVHLTEEGFSEYPHNRSTDTVHSSATSLENYRNIVLASFHYISLLRASQFESYHQHERVLLSALRFRFSEKKSPDNYATWVSEHLNWPVPPELLIAGPQLTWEWGQDGAEEKKIREYLESFRPTEGRVVLMAKKEEHEKLDAKQEWLTEPVYGTGFSVKRWDEEFIKEVCDLVVFEKGC